MSGARFGSRFYPQGTKLGTNNMKTLFSSRTKAKLIRLFFQNPNQRHHMREAERLVKERINSVRGALLSLVSQGVLNRERIGKKVFFRTNPDYIFYDELLRMVAKETGLGGRIIKERLRLGKIKVAFLTASYYQFWPRRDNELDLFIVGNVSLAEVAKLAKEEGEGLGIEINYSVMTPDELTFRRKNKDPFLVEILQKSRLMLIGKEDTLQ